MEANGHGAFEFGRDGWCNGWHVPPAVVDVTAQIAQGATVRTCVSVCVCLCVSVCVCVCLVALNSCSNLPADSPLPNRRPFGIRRTNTAVMGREAPGSSPMLPTAK